MNADIVITKELNHQWVEGSGMSKWIFIFHLKIDNEVTHEYKFSSKKDYIELSSGIIDMYPVKKVVKEIEVYERTD